MATNSREMVEAMPNFLPSSTLRAELAGMEIELRTRASIENDRKPALALVKAVEIICEAVSKTNCHELGNEQGLVIRKVIYTFVKVVNVESNPTSQTGWKSKKNYIETIEII